MQWAPSLGKYLLMLNSLCRQATLAEEQQVTAIVSSRATTILCLGQTQQLVCPVTF